MSTGKRQAIHGIWFGVLIAATNAGLIWGPAGVGLVLGVFATAMSAVEYWKAP